MAHGFCVGDRPLLGRHEHHPPWMQAFASSDPVTAVLASAIGRLHQAHRRPREDAATVHACGRWIAVGVSDGVGSRPYSRFAATHTADTLSRKLIEAVIQDAAEEPADAAPPASPSSCPAPNGAVPPANTHPVTFSPNQPRRRRIPPRQLLSQPLPDWMKRWRRRPQVWRRRVRRWLGRRRWIPPVWHRHLLKRWRRARVAEAPPSSPWRRASTEFWWLPPEPPSPMGASASSSQSSGAEATEVPGSTPNLCEVMRRSFEATHRQLQHHAERLGLSLSELSCTALALLLDTQTGELVAGQVGDGAILALRSSGEVQELLSPPETNDPQATFTLNAPDYATKLAVGQVSPAPCDPFEALFVMTDGLAGDLLYSKEPGALKTWARQVHLNLRHSPTPEVAAAGMLRWLAGYEVPGSWDDRTLVVLTLNHSSHAHSPTG